MNLDDTLKNETLMFDVSTRLLVGLVQFSRLIHNVVQHLVWLQKKTAGQNTALTDCVLSTGHRNSGVCPQLNSLQKVYFQISIFLKLTE